MNITPTNHSLALRWLLAELHGGNTFSKDILWYWLQKATIQTSGEDSVVVDAAHLRAILDYLHDSEADHYDPETYPDDAKNHVYAHVLAIEEELKARAERGGQ